MNIKSRPYRVTTFVKKFFEFKIHFLRKLLFKQENDREMLFFIYQICLESLQAFLIPFLISCI